jgi:hypothetical protein
MSKRRIIITGALSVAVVAGAVLALWPQSDDKVVVHASASQPAPAPSEEPFTSTSTSLPTTTFTTEASTSTTSAPAPTTTTGRPATTTTTQAPSTTTTRPAARTFRLSITTGPAGTETLASGSGCTGADGVSLEIRDPAGQGISGSGGAARADGNWEVPLTIPVVAPGSYRIHAACVAGATTRFVYADSTFTVT